VTTLVGGEGSATVLQAPAGLAVARDGSVLFVLQVRFSLSAT
jgi:hypothetical protein